MKKTITVIILCLMIGFSLLGCSTPTMSDDEILDRAAEILAERGSDLNTTPQESTVIEQEPSQSPLPEPTITPTPEPILDIGTRKNPVPLGQILSGSLSMSGDPLCDFEMSIIDVVRGKEAWVMIESANQFNDEPAEDKEYVVVKVHIKNTKDLTGADDALEISEYDFDLATDNDSISDNQPSIVLPKPELDIKLYEGSEDEGYIAFLVDKSDTNIKAVFAGSFWLLLQ